MDEALTLEYATERLLEDERLRSALADDEAQALLDWALAELAAAEARGAALEPVVARVRAVAREVNDLVGARHDLPPSALAGRLRALIGQPASGSASLWRWLGRSDAIDHLLRRLPTLDGPTLVRAILALLPPPSTEARP